MVSMSDLTYGQKIGVLRPGWSLHKYCVVSLDKKLCSTLSVLTQVYVHLNGSRQLIIRGNGVMD